MNFSSYVITIMIIILTVRIFINAKWHSISESLYLVLGYHTRPLKDKIHMSFSLNQYSVCSCVCCHIHLLSTRHALAHFHAEVRPAFRKSRTAGVITWAEERQADELHVEGSRVFSEIPSDFRSVGRSSFALEGSEWELEGGGERTDSAFAGTATCVATQPSVRWVESEIGTRVSSPSRVKSAKSERSMLARSAVATRRVSTGCSTTAALASGIY